MTRRISLKPTDERGQQLGRASELIAADQHDDPPLSVVIDAALQHLLGSKKNTANVRSEFDPGTIQKIANTSVIGIRYRTSIESH